MRYVGIFFVVCLLLANQNCTSSSDESNALLMLKTFYYNYGGYYAEGNNESIVKQDSLMKEYCTAKLYKKIKMDSDNVDMDPFFYTDDFDSTNLNTIVIKRDSSNMKLNQYVVSWIWSFSLPWTITYIHLTVMDGKIDSVWCNDSDLNRPLKDSGK